MDDTQLIYSVSSIGIPGGIRKIDALVPGTR